MIKVSSGSRSAHVLSTSTGSTFARNLRLYPNDELIPSSSVLRTCCVAEMMKHSHRERASEQTDANKYPKETTG